MKDILRIQTLGLSPWGMAPILLLWLTTLAFFGCGQKTDSGVFHFDLPAGQAIETLQEASRQADIEFIFSTELVSELKTPAIKGKYTPTDVFNLLLADSSFVVVQHQQSGVYSIQKIPE